MLPVVGEKGESHSMQNLAGPDVQLRILRATQRPVVSFSTAAKWFPMLVDGLV